MALKVPHQHGWWPGALTRELGLTWRMVKREVTRRAPRRSPARAQPAALMGAPP